VGLRAELGFDEFVFYWPLTLATFREARDDGAATERRRTSRGLALFDGSFG